MQYPQKPAETDLPLIDPIRVRWSPRAIGDRKVEQKKIDTLFEAARWAPSSSNLQPWHYLYATKDDGAYRERLESLLTEGNAWAKHAYILAIGFAKKTMQRSIGIVPNPYYMHDTGAASFAMALQAPSLGLIVHQMGGFNKDQANEVLGVPEEYAPTSMIAIGYPGELSQLNEKHLAQEKEPRTRRPQSAFVFHNIWPENQA
ncbi:MAG TPA: nitroreductase family protein [Candidatus Peribacteraceae bacterium]|nr:nitroreductase family protein [Candidatus Peribacteraceae bacterium]